jgi:putative dimethyl sulfoxide reductase chaperone
MKSNGHAAGSPWHTILTGELLLAGLLGKVLYTFPDRDLLAIISEEDFFADVPFAETQRAVQSGLALLQNWSQAQKSVPPEETLSQLQADYTHLFIGPGKVLAPLWESVHYGEERLVFQQETLAVRQWYQRFGLEAVDLYHEPDDHIGLELAFLAHLAGRALAALEQGESQTLALLLQAQRQFLSEHLFKWAFGWCALVGEHAQTDFYRGIAQLVEGALTELRDRTLANLPAGATA